MDWCVDPSVDSYRQTVEGDLAAHLARRIPDPVAVEAAMVQVARLLDHIPAGSTAAHRLTLRWEDDGGGTLVLQQLGGNARGAPLPGVAIGPGATASPWGPRSEAPWTGAGEPMVVALGVVRPDEEALDADVGALRLPSGRDQFLTALAAMGSRLHGCRPEEASAFAGAAASHRAEEEYRDGAGAAGPLDARHVAEAFVAYQHSIGADFEIDEASARHAVVTNRACPFGDAVVGAPQLCRFTSAMLGSMAAKNAGEASVILDERLAVGDRRCRLTLRLGPDRPAGSQRYTWPPAGIAAAIGEAQVMAAAGGAGSDRAPEAETTGGTHPSGPAGGSARTPGERMDRFGDDPDGDPPAISLSLQLPHDRDSVTLVRHLARQALTAIGVKSGVVDDVELALSEACTNVVNHAGPGDTFEVTVLVRGDRAELRVADRGRGFDFESVRNRRAEEDAERGRGLEIMAAVMDAVNFVSEPERGTLVTLTKRLTFGPGPAARLLGAIDTP